MSSIPERLEELYAGGAGGEDGGRRRGRQPTDAPRALTRRQRAAGPDSDKCRVGEECGHYGTREDNYLCSIHKRDMYVPLPGEPDWKEERNVLKVMREMSLRPAGAEFYAALEVVARRARTKMEAAREIVHVTEQRLGEPEQMELLNYEQANHLLEIIQGRANVADGGETDFEFRHYDSYPAGHLRLSDVLVKLCYLPWKFGDNRIVDSSSLCYILPRYDQPISKARLMDFLSEHARLRYSRKHNTRWM